jgi:hypothetical protein
MDHPKLTIGRTGHGDAAPRANTASHVARTHSIKLPIGSSEMSKLQVRSTAEEGHARPSARPRSSGSGG